MPLMIVQETPRHLVMFRLLVTDSFNPLLTKLQNYSFRIRQQNRRMRRNHKLRPFLHQFIDSPPALTIAASVKAPLPAHPENTNLLLEISSSATPGTIPHGIVRVTTFPHRSRDNRPHLGTWPHCR